MLENIFTFFTQLAQSCFSILKVLIRSKFLISTPKAPSEIGYLLANGPSVKGQLQTYQNQLKEKSLFVVNYFALSEQYELLKPGYYLLADPSFWGKDVSQKITLTRKKLFDTLIKTTTWPLILFIPAGALKSDFLKSYNGLNSNIQFSPYNKTPVEGFVGFSHLLFRWKLGMPRPHNVLIPSIMVSLNMKFKKIIILGADHSWLPTISVDDNNHVLVTHKHFYDSKKVTSNRMYKESVKPMRFHEVLYTFMVMFRGYFILQDYAKKQNIEILNATPDSFIDAFDRIKLEDLLKQK